ncbi:hypothetical protein [Jeongeupia chitinilytica]|uniref:hypothetical protein n=1 Tax=Jeongeupia chitinilytica TaxID=1041641 RepID=UPI0016771D07|nr:hypothetical protein [Jeongeupia chitinilytica]
MNDPVNLMGFEWLGSAINGAIRLGWATLVFIPVGVMIERYATGLSAMAWPAA